VENRQSIAVSKKNVYFCLLPGALVLVNTVVLIKTTMQLKDSRDGLFMALLAWAARLFYHNPKRIKTL
jgi:hypothetical protein